MTQSMREKKMSSVCSRYLELNRDIFSLLTFLLIVALDIFVLSDGE